jgi:hypothetical protein
LDNLRRAELLEGKGPEAKLGDTVTFHYVCRRSNGYYVYSTIEGDNTPASLPLGQGKVNPNQEPFALSQLPLPGISHMIMTHAYLGSGFSFGAFRNCLVASGGFSKAWPVSS